MAKIEKEAARDSPRITKYITTPKVSETIVPTMQFTSTTIAAALRSLIMIVFLRVS